MIRPTRIFISAREQVRIYENDRIVFQNVTFYVGKVPIFWWPYLYQSLNDSFSFSVSRRRILVRGDHRSWVRLPFRSRMKSRGACGWTTERAAVSAIGFESDMNYGKDKTATSSFTPTSLRSEPELEFYHRAT